MTPQIPLPRFYRQPVLLNSEIHGRLRIAASPSAYAFAARAQTVLLAGVEFFDAGRQFPILFARNGAGGVFPFALLGLEAGENLFVGKGGEWRGRYLPAYLRRYPFIHNESEKGMAVFIDEAFEGFGWEEGEALFDAGKPTPMMEGILVFLREYYQQMKQTEAFCAQLARLGLLRPIGAQVDFNDGRSHTLNGMLAVDEQTLRQLPDSEVLGLFRNGALALVTAHLLSLKNLSVLMELKSASNISPIPTGGPQ